MGLELTNNLIGMDIGGLNDITTQGLNDQGTPLTQPLAPTKQPTNIPLNATVESLVGSLPWVGGNNPGNSNAIPPVNSVFFRALAPKGELWDKLMPYRLLVIDTANGNQVVGGTHPSPVGV